MLEKYHLHEEIMKQYHKHKGCVEYCPSEIEEKSPVGLKGVSIG